MANSGLGMSLDGETDGEKECLLRCWIGIVGGGEEDGEGVKQERGDSSSASRLGAWIEGMEGIDGITYLSSPPKPQPCCAIACRAAGNGCGG